MIQILYGKIRNMSKRRIFYDKKADVLYFVLKEGQEEYVKEIQPNVIVEFNKDDEVIGIEILKALVAVNCVN